MTDTDDDIFGRYADEPAPLLPILHAFHERDEHISEEAMATLPPDEDGDFTGEHAEWEGKFYTYEY